jgi:uncharacterized protein (TIGR03437 family)
MNARRGMVFSAALLILSPPFARSQKLQIASFSVGPDQSLTYPNTPSAPGYIIDLPDEHTTFIPPPTTGAPYLVFAASNVSGGNWGAVILQTTDFKNFDFVTGYNHEVLTAPLQFGECQTAWANTFDENYAAPGSVVQDPTLPPGNLIMIYEAENHCPGGVNQQAFFATVGFARSSDNGKTWPAPVAGLLGGPTRHPVVQSPDPQPSGPHGYLGDAIPSAFVDKNINNEYFLYITYTNYLPETIRVARAKLGSDPLVFQKWNNGSFSQPGIGGPESTPLPAGGCLGGRHHSEISYNDDLSQYLMVFACTTGSTGALTLSWFYSTATSLDLQDWSVPQMIENSQFPVTTPCPGLTAGDQVDGWYPSLVSPGAAAGHTKLTGSVFFYNGCAGANASRQFMSRTFTITAAPPGPHISLVANAEGESPTVAPNTWLEIKGSTLAPAGDSRIWQASDFVNNQMPTKLDGVSVAVNGKNAYVYYISPTQVNVLTPPDSMTGAPQVVLANNGATSSAYTTQAQSISPSFFVFNGGPYVAATHANGTYIGPANLYPGSTTPAKPGETIVLYANGFGTTTNPVVSGSVVQSGNLVPQPVIKIGGVATVVTFAGLVLPGEFQFNVVVPPSLADGDQPVAATYNGLSTQSGTLITVQK